MVLHLYDLQVRLGSRVVQSSVKEPHSPMVAPGQADSWEWAAGRQTLQRRDFLLKYVDAMIHQFGEPEVLYFQ